MTTMTSVALVDDHLVFREAFRALLAATSEFSVVAEATEGKEVCPLFEATKPDVVVMDVTLPARAGLPAGRDEPPGNPAPQNLACAANAPREPREREYLP